MIYALHWILVTVSFLFLRFINMEFTTRPKTQIEFEYIELYDKNPMNLWESWLKEAKTLPENRYANGMTVATVRPDGHPGARTLLMRGHDARGIKIYTDYSSPKAHELTGQHNIALVFVWCFVLQNSTKPIGTRQVRIEGVAENLSRKENEEYFEQESVDSKVRAVVQHQSARLTTNARSDMIQIARHLYKRTQEDPTFKITMPEKYGGYLIRPKVFEFFQSTPHFLASRVRFRKRRDMIDETLMVPRETLPDGVYAGAEDWLYEYLEF